MDTPAFASLRVVSLHSEREVGEGSLDLQSSRDFVYYSFSLGKSHCMPKVILHLKKKKEIPCRVKIISLTLPIKWLRLPVMKLLYLIFDD